MSERTLAIIGILLALFGIVLVVVPIRSLRGRGILGLIAGFMELFPEKAQTIVGRFVGVIFVAVAAWLLVTYGEKGLSTPKKPETIAEWKQDAYDSPEYLERVRTEGPQYTRAVIEAVRARHRWYYFESPEPLVIVIVQPETYLMVKLAFLEVLGENVPAEQIAQEISGELEAALEGDRVELDKDPQKAAEIAGRQESYGPRIIQMWDEAWRAEANSTTMQTAEASLKRAADYWQLGDKQSALRYAQEARDTRLRVLGPYHPKVKEIDQMIQAASAP